MTGTTHCPEPGCKWSYTGDDEMCSVAAASHVSSVHFTDETRAALRRAVQQQRTSKTSGAVHARDCAPCDAARQIADELAALWDPHDNWSEHPSPFNEGMTLWEDVANTAATVLHQMPIPGNPSRPPAPEDPS